MGYVSFREGNPLSILASHFIPMSNCGLTRPHFNPFYWYPLCFLLWSYPGVRCSNVFHVRSSDFRFGTSIHFPTSTNSVKPSGGWRFEGVFGPNPLRVASFNTRYLKFSRSFCWFYLILMKQSKSQHTNKYAEYHCQKKHITHQQHKQLRVTQGWTMIHFHSTLSHHGFKLWKIDLHIPIQITPRHDLMKLLVGRVVRVVGRRVVLIEGLSGIIIITSLTWLVGFIGT